MAINKKNRILRRRLVIIFLSILIIVAASSGYLYIKSSLKPLDSMSKQRQIIEVPAGSSVSEIAGELEDKGIINSALAFKLYVKFTKTPGFIAGAYQLSPAMNVPDIVERLQSGKVSPAVTITVPEGTQLREIAAIIAKAINRPEQEVFRRLNDKAFIKKLMARFPNLLTSEIMNRKILYPLEGYLFPATYPFYQQKPTVDDIVITMLAKTNSVIAGYRGRFKQDKWSTHELLTMASLIEEEATGKVDRKKIASVFYNRLKKGMPLQTDPTVLYAQGKHKERVFYHDLEVKSPYNTYQNKGLPPGPIANSGRVSLEAALSPAKTDYYYFLAAADGSVIFSKSLTEHNREKAKYISSKK